MWKAPFWRINRAWRRDTLRSVSWIVLPSRRPIVISSRANGTTVVLPSSSSIVSLNTAEIRRSDDFIRRGGDGQSRERGHPSRGAAPNAAAAAPLFYEDQRGGDDDRHADDERRDHDG